MRHVYSSLRAASQILRRIVLVASLAALSGCQSIHSNAVVELIEIEHDKVKEAKKNAKSFDKNTKARVEALKKGIADLDDSLQQLKRVEAKHALVFSSNQNLSSKKGVDAHSVAYMIGRIYVSDQLGLEQQVKDQFEADFAMLNKLSKDINESWESIEKLQGKVLAFSKQSALASVDPEFVKAIMEEASIDTSTMDDVIKRSKQINTALKQWIGNAGDGQKTASSAQALDDLVELLVKVH